MKNFLKKLNQNKTIIKVKDTANNHINTFQKLLLESKTFNTGLDVFIYLILIISVLYVLISVFTFNSYAGEVTCDKAAMQDYIQSEYGLAPDEWDCSQESKHKYSIVIEYPVRRICHIREDIIYLGGKSNTSTLSTCDADIATNIGTDGEVHIIGDVLEYGYQTHTTTLQEQVKKEVQGTKNKDPLQVQIGIIQQLGIAHDTTTYEYVLENVEVPAYKTHDIEAFLSGYTTIYSKKQLEMSNVDINIIDGKVKVTGILDDDTEGWNVIYEKYKIAINGFLGLCVLSCILVFIVSSIKLGATAGNPGERKKVMTAMLLSGIGTAALGAVILFFSFFFNLI